MKLKSGGLKVLIFTFIFLIGVLIAYNILSPDHRLRVYQPAEINPRLVDSSLQEKYSDHRIQDFRLLTQDSQMVSLKDFEDKIIVADFFFTTCPSICPKMSAHLKELCNAYPEKEDLVILSHTVTPELDPPHILKAYAQEYEAPENWYFLTGDRKEIYKLARKSYFAALDEPSTEGPDFVHTENFVLVDKEGRLRGFYDGTSSLDTERLINDIAILSKEYE
ncbi:MAG: SCO family protein [Luteibaculum sp.]